jgi:hypothetical protein
VNPLPKKLQTKSEERPSMNQFSLLGDLVDIEKRNAFGKVMNWKNDVALKAFARLLETKEGAFTHDLADQLQEPIANVRRALNALEQLNLVSKQKKKRKKARADFWTVSKRVSYFGRTIPSSYFTKGIPADFQSEVPSENWETRYGDLAKLFTASTEINWILTKEITWKIHRNGLMEYFEQRKYLKLSNRFPFVAYNTLFSLKDLYYAVITNEFNQDIPFEQNIFTHSLKDLTIFSAALSPEIVKRDYNAIRLGDHYTVNIRDKKRLYVCKLNKNEFSACFHYWLKLSQLDKLQLNYEFSKFIGVESCEIFLNKKQRIGEINLTNSNNGVAKPFKWTIDVKKNRVAIQIEGSQLLASGQELLLLFKLKPPHPSDTKNWIELKDTEICPCGTIPPLVLNSLTI